MRLQNSTRLAVALAAVFVLALPVTSAFAGRLTLHPSGFGEKSYAAWKAHEGLPDSTGRDDQALYFQKAAPSSTFAAGAAVIRGIEGLPAQQLTGLAWDHREDGHCGAGAPRWNVNYQVGMMQQTLFLGCNAAQHSQAGTGSGHGWCRDDFPSPTAGLPVGATISSLVIIFDEGTDTPNPPPAGCDQEQFVGGFVHLDNITVEIDGQPHVWTSANDNGNR